METSRTDLIMKRLKLPLFHINYEVIMGYKMKDIFEFFKKHHSGINTDMLDQNAGGYTLIIEGKTQTSLTMLIDLSKRNNKPSVLKTIVHESAHMSKNMIDLIGIKPTEDNELQAYIQEEIFERCVEIASELDEKFKKVLAL